MSVSGLTPLWLDLPGLGLPWMAPPGLGLPRLGLHGMGLPGMGLPEMGLPRLYLPGLGLPARGAQPGNYHDTLSYQPREDHAARLQFQLREKKLLREGPNSPHFDLAGGGMRMPASGPHPGTSALGRRPGGSMDWGEQEREMQEVSR